MGGSRPTKPQCRTNIPFDLDEIARYEKWGHYMAASTTNNETAQKVRVTLLLAKVEVMIGVLYMAEPNACWHISQSCQD